MSDREENVDEFLSLDGEDSPLFKRDAQSILEERTSPKVLALEHKQKNKERKMRSAFWFVVGSLIAAGVIYAVETFWLKTVGIGKEVLEILKVIIYTSMGYLFSKKDKE